MGIDVHVLISPEEVKRNRPKLRGPPSEDLVREMGGSVLLKMYLDSSAIVKRYILEPGSSAIDHVFDRCWVGELYVVTSVWNIGEVLGVLDVRRKRGWLSGDEFMRVLRNFAGEVIGLLRLRALEILPVLTSILVETWPLILGNMFMRLMLFKLRRAYTLVVIYS